PIRRVRLLALAAGSPAGGRGFSSAGLGRGGAEPDRGGPEPGATGEANAAAIAGGPCPGPRAFLLFRAAGAGRGPDRGLVHRRRGGWLQHYASAAAGDARRLQRGGDPAAAAARAVPHGL